MTDQFGPKLINPYVAIPQGHLELSHSRAITFVSRLDLDHFEFQLNLPRFNQLVP